MTPELSIPVIWVEDGGTPLPGRLDVFGDRLMLDGGSRELPRTRQLPFAEIDSVRIGRDNGDRIAGRPAVILQLAAGGIVALAGFGRAGGLHELVHRLEALL